MLRSAPMAVLSSPVSKPLWPRCAVAGILGTASAAGAMAPASVATATGSFIKGLPGIGTVIGALSAGSLRRRYLGDRQGFHPAFCFGWNASRLQSTGLS